MKGSFLAGLILLVACQPNAADIAAAERARRLCAAARVAGTITLRQQHLETEISEWRELLVHEQQRYEEYESRLTPLVDQVIAASAGGAGPAYQRALSELDAARDESVLKAEEIQVGVDSVATLEQLLAMAYDFSDYIELRIRILAQEDSAVRARSPADSARHATNAAALQEQVAANDRAEYAALFSSEFAKELQSTDCAQ